MNTIKKIGVLVILLGFFLSLPVLESQERRFTISPAMGVLHGRAEEIVFRFPDQNLYYSELLWDLRPLFYVGFSADFGPANPFQQNGLFMALSLKYGLPLRTGVLENRDWLNPRHNYYTHFSRHDAYSRGAFFSSLSAGYSLSLNNSLALRAFGEFSYKRLSWSGMYGFTQYPTFDPLRNYPRWNDTLPRNYAGLRGEVIRYTQNWFILAPGLSLMWKPNPVFLLAGTFSYSPLIYCYARDDHFLRDLTFHDYLFFGHYLRSSVEFIFWPDNNIELLFELSYTRLTGTRGDTVVSGHRFRQGAGAGLTAFGFSLAARLRPFNWH